MPVTPVTSDCAAWYSLMTVSPSANTIPRRRAGAVEASAAAIVPFLQR
jgi:hypothetical protein